MVRRVRKEIERYYKDDMKKQGLSFPKLGTPEQIVYEFDEKIDKIFDELLNLISGLTYARYKSLAYLKNPSEENRSLMAGQMNLKGFMKSLLIKRLESSFFAFEKSVGRFKDSYINFIEMYNAGNIYISKKHNVYDLMGSDDDERLLELVDEGEIKYYIPEDLDESFIDDLNKDLVILENIHKKIKKIDSDPKIECFIEELKNNKLLKGKKKVIFTESKETAQYLKQRLKEKITDGVLAFTGSSSNSLKDVIRANYDPNYPEKNQQDDLEILITTDVLAEGINLHRANVLINYDLPWNPTRIMQRVGRINRIGTTFDEIFVFNFFPTTKSNKHLSLKENIINKIQSFHNTFGEDSKFLTEDETVESYGFMSDKLYEDLNKDLEKDEDEWDDSELKYLKIIRSIRDLDEKLFIKIKELPKKARTGKQGKTKKDRVISFIRDGELKRLYISDSNFNAKELTFFEGVKILKCKKEEKQIKINKNYYHMLFNNKEHFRMDKSDKVKGPKKKQGTDAKVLKIIKALENYKKKFTEKEEEKLSKFKELFEGGYFSKEIIKNINKEIDILIKKTPNPHRILEVIHEMIPENYKHIQKIDLNSTTGKIEVLLSEYLDSSL
uniref:Helicase n=1 Tax=Hirondellea gigas TaxID=1518452 RepID=A0A6A7G6X9_9CRUS